IEAAKPRATQSWILHSKEPVCRTADGSGAAVEDVGVDHGRAHVLVTQELLDGPDIVAFLQQMRCEGVPEGVAACGLGDGGCQDCASDGALEDRLVEVVSSELSGG